MRRRYEERRRAARAKATAAAATTATSSSSSVDTSTSSSSSSVATTATTTGAKKRHSIIQQPAAQFKLHVHGHEFQNGDELVLNPEHFPQLKELVLKDYVVEVYHPTEDDLNQEHHQQHENVNSDISTNARQHLLLEIPENSAPVKGKMQVSVLKDTAAFFQLQPFKDVMVRFVPKAQVLVDFVEVSLKDQFMSRRDLWYLQKSLVGVALSVGKNIRVHGSRWHVMDIRASGGEKVRSGVVSETTKFAFRSRTSRVMWLVQVSPEMWDMANSGKLYMEIFLDVVKSVLNKWIKHKVSHSLTILFYSRSYFPEMDRDSITGSIRNSPSMYRRTQRKLSNTNADAEPESTFPYERKDYFPIGVDENGRHYQDFYKIVAFDSLVTDMEPLLVRIKYEMNCFPIACGWKSPAAQYDWSRHGTTASPTSEHSVIPRMGIPSNARDGNLLEAINLVLNIFEKHHIDRHLARSGQSVVLFTAGNGIFSVNKRLSEITEQRMMDHGIGIDLISLATPPLHKCPLFLFKQSNMTEMKLPGRLGEGNNAADICVCNTNQQASKAYQRRSRAASSDGMPESLAGFDLAVSSIRGNQLCKYCTQRQESRKRYVVPLWIPLCFVQEETMVAHECPLCEDITQSCSVCHPKITRQKDFEPLPMCRMFKNDDLPMFASLSLPKPLERLLKGFDDQSGEESDDEHDRLMSRTMTSDVSTYDEFLHGGLDSDLVRARASSIASTDESVMTDVSDIRSKSHIFSQADHNRLVQEFEKYDDEAFGFNSLRKSLIPKSSDGDISGRLCLTPPLRPSNPASGSALKKRAFQSGSAGNGNGSGHDHIGSNGGHQWRSFDRSPSPLNVDQRGSVASDGKLVSSDDTSGEEPGKSRNATGSLPNTYHLDSGPSHAPYTTSPMLRPVDGTGKDDLFQTHASIFKQLTSNQRRWSQIRPAEDFLYKLVQNMLKWKSLCFPALLPLTTDFIPGPKELQAHYTQYFYSVILPERDEENRVTFRDYRELVMEMVAQRFSQDFQLVTVEDSNASTKKNAPVYRLSMGHRIHEIMYNEETQTIDVKRYLQKVTTRSDVDIMEYRYSLWSPVADGFLSVSQQFRKYPQIEYAWNYLDQLICGYYDDMSEAIRYKRILYCIAPPALDGSENDKENLNIYTERCHKFFEHLRSKADTSTGFPDVKVSTEWKESMTTSGLGAFKRVSYENVKFPLHTSDAPTSQNWITVKMDTELLSTQCFHLEVQWLVCRSSLVEDFITGIVRRAKQLGLEFLQVAQNGISNNLDVHALVCPIFLPLSHSFEQQLVEQFLVKRLDFCCEALHPIPLTHLNHDEEYKIITPEQRGGRTTRRATAHYRQYVHRTLSCFVRVTQTGLVWISNNKLYDADIQAVFEALKQHVHSIRVAHATLSQIVDKAMDSVEIEQGNGKKALQDATPEQMGEGDGYINGSSENDNEHQLDPLKFGGENKVSSLLSAHTEEEPVKP